MVAGLHVAVGWKKSARRLSVELMVGGWWLESHNVAR
jgi:hypothetical protein